MQTKILSKPCPIFYPISTLYLPLDFHLVFSLQTGSRALSNNFVHNTVGIIICFLFRHFPGPGGAFQKFKLATSFSVRSYLLQLPLYLHIQYLIVGFKNSTLKLYCETREERCLIWMFIVGQCLLRGGYIIRVVVTSNHCQSVM